ncbi:MAG: RNA polymerase subunit sigma-24 [Gemmatimonadetes bacterium]|nr:RNA polymerase subunit sigma-24 [Gemmatimonadota bacterium]
MRAARRGALLHVLNGDATAAVLARSGVPGDRLPFREALISGPTPFGVRTEAWRSLRAAHLADEAGLDVQDVERALLEQEQALEGIADHAEVVLWFEHDLFCQVNLVHLLSRFAELDAPETRISMVDVGELVTVEGFRGLGQLSPEDLVALFESRREVTEAQTAAAVQAWAAYRSPDPASLEDVLATGTSPLPFLHEALTCHLARFPSVRNGLGHVENVALGRIADGVGSFSSLFDEFGVAYPGYGLGDTQFRACLDRLAVGRDPLLGLEGNGEDEAHLRYTLTGTGRRVLQNERDFIETNGLDVWLGGVHLRDGATVWRWDERSEELVAQPPGGP